MSSAILQSRLQAAVEDQQLSGLGPFGLIDRLKEIIGDLVDTVPEDQAIATIEQFWQNVVVPIPWGIPGEVIAEAVGLRIVKRVVHGIYQRNA